jgi:hypothetical protein
MIIDVSHLLSWMDTLMWACDMVTNVITVGRGAATRCRTRSPRSIRPHWTIPERKNTECISSCELGICNEIRFSSHLCQMVLTRALLLLFVSLSRQARPTQSRLLQVCPFCVTTENRLDVLVGNLWESTIGGRIELGLSGPNVGDLQAWRINSSIGPA